MAAKHGRDLGHLPSKGNFKGPPKGFHFSHRPDSSSTTTDSDFVVMDRRLNQHRLYVINRSGSGEAQYVLLNNDRTEIASYGVRLETWRVIKDVADFGVAVVDNVLYVIGGYDKVNCRHLHRVVNFSQTIGGYDNVDCRHLHRVVKYDPFETSWIQCAPLLKARSKFGVCVLQGRIYVCGGERSDGQSSCSSEVYEPRLDQWTEGGVMVAPRKNHGCARVGEDLYLAGGDFGTRSHNNLWIYEKGRWEELDHECPQTMPRNIDRFAICPVGQKIYFIGGVSCKTNDSGDSKFTTERGMFSYATNVTASAIVQNKRNSSSIHDLSRRPSNISEMSRVHSHLHGLDVVTPWTTKYPSMVRPRHSCGAHAIGSKVYVFGGCHLETGQDVRVCECYDTLKGTWEDEFHFRKGDMSSVVTAALDVPRRHDEQKVKYRLKWVMW